MMTQEDNVHPDEGTIHAWLDDALGDEASRRIETHVSSCSGCAALVAEARGLIAGASRVVGMLDVKPASQIRPILAPVAQSGSLWRTLRVTPARSAIAAALIVAVGLVLTRERGAVDGGRVDTTASQGAAPASEVAQSPPNAERTPDSVLSSAIVARLKKDQPERVLKRAEGVAVVIPPAPSVPLLGDVSAMSRVAAARSSLNAQRDTMAVPADRARVGFAPPAAPGNASAEQRIITAAKAAGDVVMQAVRPRGDTSGANVSSFVLACYRVEAADTRRVVWGNVTLPIVLAFDSVGRSARVIGADGQSTQMLTTVARADNDSIIFRLRALGYSGTMRLGATGGAHRGEMTSGPVTFTLSGEITTTGVAEAPAREPVAGRRADSLVVPPPVKSLAPAGNAQRTAVVTASRTSCPR